MLDLLLASYLLVVLPVRALWRSRRTKTARPSRPRLRVYRDSARDVLVLLAVLAVSCWLQGRPPAALGFDVPLTPAGQWGLGVAILVLASLGIGSRLWEKKLSQAKRDEYDRLVQDNDTLPRTLPELRAFLVLGVVLGAGWEILYRGFLLLVLTPFTGTTGAVALSALAYGAGHGFDSRKQFVGSIVAAFVFTIAYALTHSLWWLIVLHAGVACSGGLSAYGKFKTGPSPPVAAPTT
jgi:membrane protease YdiL (CAAX protease family)